MRLLGLIFVTAGSLFLWPIPIPAVEIETVTYTSSLDLVSLEVTTVFPDNASGCPILVVMHGYSGGMDAVQATQIMLAERGLFTVAPAMRGRNGSGGYADDSARELYDIIDAVDEVLSLYTQECDPENINIVGYSGGGGNVFGCMAKFPDRFRLAAGFFGMSDYGFDLEHGWYNYGGYGYQETLRERIGGAPEDVPDAYMARCSLLAVRNTRYTTLQLYVDSEEQVCPVYNDTAYVRIAEDLGLTNVSLNMSTPDSLHRWYHGYPSGEPNLIEAFDYFVPGILKGAYPQPEVDRVGEATILGYFDIGPYQIMLENGKDEVADLTYDVSGDATHRETAWRFDLRSRTQRVHVLILKLRGLEPQTPYVLENEDLTHDTVHIVGASTDSIGFVLFTTALDTLSVLRVYQGTPTGFDIDSGDNLTTPSVWCRAWPNPSSGETRLHVSVEPHLAVGLLRILDLTGRVVIQLQPSRVGPSGLAYIWNGYDRMGARVPGGTYYVLFHSPSVRICEKLVLLR